MGYLDRPRGPSFARVLGGLSIAMAVVIIVLTAASPGAATTGEQPPAERQSGQMK